LGRCPATTPTTPSILACLPADFWLWNRQYLVDGHAWMGGQSSVEQICSSSAFMARQWQRTTKRRGASHLMVDTLQSVFARSVGSGSTKMQCVGMGESGSFNFPHSARNLTVTVVFNCTLSGSKSIISSSCCPRPCPPPCAATRERKPCA
jgi:hypothetical protein